MAADSKKSSVREALPSVGFVLVLGLAAALVYWYVRRFNLSDSLGYWGWVVGLLPACTVVLQSLFLIYIKRYAVRDFIAASPDDSAQEPKPSAPAQKPSEQATGNQPSLSAKKGVASVAPQRSPAATDGSSRDDLAQARKSAQSVSDRFFHPFFVGIQYSAVAALLAITGLTVLGLCISPPCKLLQSPGCEESGVATSFPAPPRESAVTPKRQDDSAAKPSDTGGSTGKQSTAPPESKAAGNSKSPFPIDHISFLTAFRLGAAGAYTYVLVYLGRRSFWRDITTGAALWSAMQLILGPIMACTIAYFLTPNVGADPSVGFGAIYFVAGLSPRLIADWISDAVQRSWVSGGAQAAPRRTIPLGTVRGITPTIEGRLNEEGLEDAAGLAAANPIKLIRSTPFDARQILGWIDEAILICTLPKHWAELEQFGITGAIDLAWYSIDDDGERTDKSTLSRRQEALRAIASRVGIEPQDLVDTALRLYYDDQLEAVWAIYESDGDGQTTPSLTA